MSEATFEPEQGWVPVSPEGTVWRHRARGSAGVLVFEREEDGRRRYEATHQDCFSSDTSLTTHSRRRAVRFAASGAEHDGEWGEHRGSVQPAVPRAPHEPSPGDPAAGAAAGACEELAPESEASRAVQGALMTRESVLEALPHLSHEDRKLILARLLELGERDAAARGEPRP